ncbi:MAG: DUF1963 domain-containing protein [Myxococcaceae bacterium]|nr:DUF1963 domain-containing protein [Myxococcaceae bacterium]
MFDWRRMTVVTRSFVRDGQFFEMSWDGPEVETVSGAVGKAGRARSQHFASIEERDAWIQQKVAKVLREGWVEGKPGDVPTPDPEVPQPEVLTRYQQPTWLPVFESGDPRTGSKLGGTPWLDATWPECPRCTKPMRFLLQLARDEVPTGFRELFREALLQLFFCTDPGKPGDAGWLCQAEDGWEPFSGSALVRHVAVQGAPLELGAALSIAQRERLVGFNTASLDAYCESIGDPPPAARSPAELAASVEAMAVVPADLTDFLQGQRWVLPPQRIARFDERVEVPAYGDVDPETLDRLAEQGLECFAGHKLGGSPKWAQAPQVPSCRACRTPMRFLFQLTTSGPVQIGGDGIGWLFVCATCRDATFTWQR